MTRTTTDPVASAAPTLSTLLAAATDALHEHGLEATGIVAADPVRRTVTARVTRRGTRSALIAKWIAADAPPRTRGAFENETRFYRDWRPDLPAPEPVSIERDVIVLSDAGGRTLRAFLADTLRRPDAERATDVRTDLELAFTTIASWTADGLARGTAAGPAPVDVAALDRRLATVRTALATGGPDVGTPAAAVGAALERATRPGFSAAVAPILGGQPELGAVGWTHAALDAGNVLLTRDGRALLLSFGSWSPSGSVVVDPVHALATALVMTSSRPGLRALVRDAAARALADRSATAHLATGIVSLAAALEPVGRQNSGLNRGADSRSVLRERLSLLRSAVPRGRGR
ncbi:MAG: hypothetical protein ACJ77B_02150 [Chloroflexota bacterium]